MNPVRPLGRLFAINTMAGVIGAVVTGFVLLPWLGSQDALWVLGAMSVLGAGAGWIWMHRQTGLRAAAALIPVVAVLGMRVSLESDHTTQVFFHRGTPTVIEHLDEGRSNTIAVGTRMMFGQPYFRELMTPGVSMSDTRFLARRYMAMMAHLPVLFAQKSDRALLICYGVGNTARALLSHPDLGGLDVVDISQEAISSSPWFAEMTTGDPLTDARTTVTIDDGRHHLVTTDQQYDVITSEPPPPKPKVLGIDLGTTYSVAAFYHAVRALSGRLSALSVFHSKSVL